MFRISKETELTLPLLQEFLDKHNAEVNSRFKKLQDAYMSDHEILHEPAKPKYKPDNRIVVNFPKYIVDTMNGFFIGNPIKTVSDDKKVTEYVEYLDQYNDQDDNNAELSKICSIFGKGYEMYFADEEAQLCITYLSPMESFMIFDDSILERPLYFVRRYTDRENNEYGSISNADGVRYFKVTGGLSWLDASEEEQAADPIKYANGWKRHFFNDVPATEYTENSERQGLFEPVMTLVNSYNKALSEKANDVDYFADAYLKLFGPKLDTEDVQHIRDNRIINFEADDLTKIIAEFMDKPSNDAGQENFLDRQERLIFQISMVANISDENFGASSGIALQYKLQAMSNLEKTKERKFASGMNRRYKLLFSHPASKVPADAWTQLHYRFTPNIPANMLEEAQIAAQMEGIVSHETQLKVLSIVDDVQGELEKIEEENAAAEETVVDQMMFGNAGQAQPSDNAEKENVENQQ